jgi:serine/threonine protein phosphatase PrpC
MKWYGQSDTGQRREHNEDNWCIDPALSLAMVADGMGGHAAGEVASGIVVETVRTQLGVESNGEALLARLRTAVEAAHAAVLASAKADPARRGMGSTVTAAVVQAGYYHLAHVGDSRAYLLRAGQLFRLTRDHTIVEDMVMAGMMTAEEAERSPQRHILRQAVGAEQITVDLYRGFFHRDDTLLLCSDGLHDMLPDARIEAILRQNAGVPDAAAQQLIDAANAAGGEDNITVVLVTGDGMHGTPERVNADTMDLTTISTALQHDIPTPPQRKRRGCLAGVILLLIMAALAAAILAPQSRQYRWNMTATPPRLETLFWGITLPGGDPLPAQLGNAALIPLVTASESSAKSYAKLRSTRYARTATARAELRKVIHAALDAPLESYRQMREHLRRMPEITVAGFGTELPTLKSARAIAAAFKPYDEQAMTTYLEELDAAIAWLSTPSEEWPNQWP